MPVKPYQRGRRLPRWLVVLLLGPLTLLAALIALPVAGVRAAWRWLRVC